ncbi:MAG: Smr/MutS family protein [bacterium]|nr:Smr/MutS family protein [bacterium]
MRAAEQYRTLEFDRLLKQLGGYAQSEVTRELIENIEVVFHPARVDENLDQTTEALKFANDNPAVELPSFSAITDLRQLLSRIGLGELVSAQEARSLLAFFDTSAEFDAFRARLAASRYPRLADASASWQAITDLQQQTRRIFSDVGEIKDNASRELSRIRTSLRRFEGDAKQLMDPLLKSVRDSSGEEGLITVRHHRFVVLMPRSELRNHRGSVVDVSSTGQSVYFEPQGLAHANMERQHLFLDEDAELRRILRDYGGALSLRMPSLLANLGVLVRFDYIQARVRFAQALSANRPAMTADGGFILRRAVHPLLYRSFVAGDLSFDSQRALIISGVNAGGKTVLLKLLGLYSLMAALGCFVPGDAQLPYISGVCAYIGDEQSTAHNLSTFTAHLKFVEGLFETLNELPGSTPLLVLIDEVGTGTEPSEGQAFAYGLISTLLDHPVKLAVTTHFDLLKVIGLERDDVKNVSLQFDQEKLKPTYRVLDDQPGRSFALAIARRWGIPVEVVDRAESVIGDEERRMGSVIGELERLRAEAEDAHAVAKSRAQEVESAKAQAEELDLELKRAKQRFAQQSERMKTEMKQRIEELLTETKRKLKNKTRQVVRKQDEYVKAVSKTAGVVRTQQSEAEELVDAMLAELDVQVEQLAPSGSGLAVGDMAAVEGSSIRGEVAELHVSKGEAVLAVSGKRMTVKLRQLRKVTSAAPKPVDPLAKFKPKTVEPAASSRLGVEKPQGHISTSYALQMQDSADTLDLHGYTIEEAREQLDEFISSCLLTNVGTVRIMHGVGTGRLRTFVQDYLKKEAHVKSVREAPGKEGGLGVTLAELV